jgi:hypothetical protein
VELLDIARMHNLLDAIERESDFQGELSTDRAGDVHREIHLALDRILRHYRGGAGFSSAL